MNQQKFWTEHRHNGLDIVIMGQDRGDVHKIIRNRIRTVIYFLKLEAVGRPKSYKWELYSKQSFGKFVKTGSGLRSYEDKYFGTYLSHREEGTRSSVYTTSRTNMVSNSKALSYGLPLCFLVAGFAVYYLYGFFHPTHNAPSQAVTVTHSPDPVASGPTNPPPTAVAGALPAAQAVASPVVNPAPVAIDYFDKLAQTLTIRASAIIDSKKPGKELLGYVELLDSSYHVKERFKVEEIRALGWTVTRTGYGMLLEKQNVSYVARSWPIDVYGNVDNRTVQALSGRSASAPAGQGLDGSSPKVTVVNSGKPGMLW